MRCRMIVMLMIVAGGMVRSRLLGALAVVCVVAKQHGRARVTPNWQGHGEKQQHD